jgi:chitin synthase
MISIMIAFDRDPNLGGACGEIITDWNLKTCWNPLVASQHFEYKISNQLDKPLESIFGYIQVLPGAFSAYRYKALQNSSLNTGPLASYFHGDNQTNYSNNIFSANMYLAEDRILCFELITKAGQCWTLKYVKNARAITDTPKSLSELILQVTI